MRAMVLAEQGPVTDRRLSLESRPDPEPGPDEILLEVAACGVCRTDLHVVEGDLPARTLPVVPGHQVVGRVRDRGARVEAFEEGDRAGVAWVHRFCGRCAACRRGAENLCTDPTFTGYHRDGGYADLVTAPAAFAHPVPEDLGPAVACAPLLCGGIIGYRALERAELPPAGRLLVVGFGASAHVTIQIARARGAEVWVRTRSPASQERARAMGASWSGGPDDRLPGRVDAAVTFAPVGSVIPPTLAALRRGGRLSIAGVTLDEVPGLDYGRHLDGEREIVSVWANTREDARELLDLAARLGVETDTCTYPLQEANEALVALKEGGLPAQAAVLTVEA